MPKMRLAWSGSTPRPLSRTVTTQPSLPFRAETADARRRLAAELHRVADEVLQHAAQLAGIAVDLGQGSHLERRAELVEARPQVGRHVAHHAVEGDALALQLAGARVVEDGVDELACALGARAQQREHLGRRRLARMALEQRDEVGDPGDRLAQVMGDHVGVAAQLGLHPPLAGHVRDEDDQAVAELGRAPQDVALDVAVAERRVEVDLVAQRLARVADAHVRVEMAVVAHDRQRLEQRVAPALRARELEHAHDHRVAVAELEVDDAAALAADRPQQPDAVREPVEHRAKALRALLAEQGVEMRIFVPRLGLDHGPSISAVGTSA